MVKISSILLLLVYLSAWLKPYFPYLEYEVNKEHIAKNLCENKAKPEMKCNGKCHRTKQIQRIAQEEVPAKDKPAPQPKVESKEVLFFLPKVSSDIAVESNLKDETIKVCLLSFYDSVNQDQPTPPPQIIG